MLAVQAGERMLGQHFREPNLPPPGWYPAPDGGGELAWWNGTAWADAPPVDAPDARTLASPPGAKGATRSSVRNHIPSFKAPRSRVRAMLGHGSPASFDEVVRQTHLSEDEVHDALDALLDSGDVTATAKGFVLSPLDGRPSYQNQYGQFLQVGAAHYDTVEVGSRTTSPRGVFRRPWWNDRVVQVASAAALVMAGIQVWRQHSVGTVPVGGDALSRWQLAVAFDFVFEFFTAAVIFAVLGASVRMFVYWLRDRGS